MTSWCMVCPTNFFLPCRTQPNTKSAMPSDLLTSSAITRQPPPTGVGTNHDAVAQLLALVRQIDAKMDEVQERVGLKQTTLSLTNTPHLHLPLGEWSISPGGNWLNVRAGDGTELARVPMEIETAYPDVLKLLSRAKMTYAVLCELLELFRLGGTTKADTLNAVFVMNDRPLNPTTVTTFINMLAVVNNVERP